MLLPMQKNCDMRPLEDANIYLSVLDAGHGWRIDYDTSGIVRLEVLFGVVHFIVSYSSLLSVCLPLWFVHGLTYSPHEGFEDKA